jgi:cysteine desulfurase
MKNRVYLDYAATTPTDPRVVKTMIPYFTRNFGNTVSLHSYGQEAMEKLEDARRVMAQSLNAKSSEIIFTSSATESNNFALKGIAFANKNRGKHIIISAIEHACILNSAQWLEKQGFEISKVKVDQNGIVDLNDLKKKIRKDTLLISIMHANNEIGTIQPIKEIGQICKDNDIYFHTDAAQSFGKEEINVEEMNIDLLTASSHKMYGPKGVGLLFLREKTKIDPLLHGGGHEFGLRSSTSNLPGIIGFAKALQLEKELNPEENKRIREMRDRLIEGILNQIKDCRLNGHPEKRLDNNVNVAFSFIEGESLLIQLDALGIAASTGSACSSHKLQSSHVLQAIGLKPKEIQGSLRLSLGRWSKEKDIDYVLEVLPGAVEKLRKISPFRK